MSVIDGGDEPALVVDHPLIRVLRAPVRVTDACDLLDQLVDQTAALAAM